MDTDKNIIDVKYLKNKNDNIECYNELFEKIGDNNTSEIYKDRLLSKYLKKPIGIFLYSLSFIIALIVFFQIGFKDPESSKNNIFIGLLSFVVSGTIYGVSAGVIHTQIFKKKSTSDTSENITEDFEATSKAISIIGGVILGIIMILMIIYNYGYSHSEEDLVKNE